jgi:AraC-like DNA-binding protein
MNPFNQASISAIYPLAMLQLAEERGIAAERILHNASLTVAALRQPSARITPSQQAVISYNLLTQTGDPGIGLALGLRSNITKTGLMGFGMMSCATFGELANLGVRYLKTRVPYFDLSLSIEGDMAVVQAREVIPMGAMHQFGFDHFMAEVYEICHAFTSPKSLSQAHTATEIWFDSPQQPYYADYAARLPRLRFNMPANQFRFTADLLSVAIPTANPVSAQLAFEQCEREMALLGYTQSVPDRIRALLNSCAGQYPSLEAAAQRMHMSSRTLKRRLAEQDTTFGELLEDVRKRDTLELLLNTDRSIEHIALRAGYADPANFRRAFKRWTGQSPTDWREQQKALPEG